VNADTPYSSRLRTKLSATSGWRRSGGSSKGMAPTAAEERRELKSERALRVMRMATTIEGIPFLKKDSPTDAPRHRRRSRPTRAKVTQPLTRGPGLTSHTPWASTSVCGKDEPPREELATVCGSAPLRLHRKRPSLFVSAECSGPASDTGAWAHESYSLGVGLHVRRG
jgi:hypothetical protein